MTDDKLLRDPMALARSLIQRGEDWADRQHAASLLEETKSTLLAKIMREYAVKDLAMNKVEMLAKGDSRYEQHIRAMVDAQREATKAKVRYDTGRAFIDMARSREATTRAEMGLR